jgi:hypothetical protein
VNPDAELGASGLAPRGRTRREGHSRGRGRTRPSLAPTPSVTGLAPVIGFDVANNKRLHLIIAASVRNTAS